MPEDERRGDDRSAPEAGGTEQRGGDTCVIRRVQPGGEGNQEMGGGCIANGFLQNFTVRCGEKTKIGRGLGRKRNKRKHQNLNLGEVERTGSSVPTAQSPAQTPHGLQWMGQTAQTQRRGPRRAWSLGLIELSNTRAWGHLPNLTRSGGPPRAWESHHDLFPGGAQQTCHGCKDQSTKSQKEIR